MSLVSKILHSIKPEKPQPPIAEPLPNRFQYYSSVDTGRLIIRDPMELWLRLYTPEFNDDEKDAEFDKEAERRYYDHLFEVFELDRFDNNTGNGATLMLAQQLYEDFIIYLEDLKKKLERSPTRRRLSELIGVDLPPQNDLDSTSTSSTSSEESNGSYSKPYQMPSAEAPDQESMKQWQTPPQKEEQTGTPSK